MNEQIFTASNGIEVIYRHKPSKYDFKHLIVVFSGFLNATPGNYDFINALTDCPADVIWINDNFQGMYTYYLCIDMDFRVKEAVQEFIQSQIDQRNLSPENVTFTGFSKGGSAALYHALSMNIKNIVVTVPQLHIGNYVDNFWKSVATHMMGKNYQKAQIDYLDKLIVNLLKKDQDLDKNIYLLTSEADIQFPTEIQPHLDDFRKYRNFNLLKTYSAFVREHNQVTSHHTALLLGIYYALASEATPRFNQGEVNFFGTQPIPKPNVANPTPYVDVRNCEYKDNILFIEGIAILRGVHISNYSDVQYELILQNTRTRETYTKGLAKLHRPHLTRELFDGDFVIYDKGYFTTLDLKGIDISDLPKAEYQLYIAIKSGEYYSKLALSSQKTLTKSSDTFSFNSNSSLAILELFKE